MRFLPFFIISILLLSCSAEKSGIFHQAFHNTTAHYNAYYYSKERIREVEKVIQRSVQPDYNKILRLYPALDSNLSKQYKKDTDEAIKKASIAIERHPNSKWLDDSYMMVGLARLYDYDFVNAIQTFKYINKISKDHPTRHRALIYLMRTFTESGDYQNAVAVSDYLKKEKLNKQNLKDLYLERAYYYQVREDYDNMIKNLSEAEPLLTRRDGHSRVYFIIGQVYQKLGFESEAYRFYRKCLATNPPYELDFYSRLNMAQVTELSSRSDVRTARKHFSRLLKDKKNRDFKDQIYYEMAEFEFKQGNLDESIEFFNQSVRNGKNTLVKGASYLRLGQIYYDSIRNYETSKAYYDSALNTLPKDYDNYTKLQERQKILADFVEQIKTIHFQDSLLSLAKLDTAELRILLEASLSESQKGKNNGGKKSRRSYRSSSSSVSSSSFDLGGSSGTSEWYFSNLSAVALGQNEFQRVWGSIPLEDNWRRSSKTTTLRPGSQSTAEEASETSGNAISSSTTPQSNAEKISAIMVQIPRTEEQQLASLRKIENATFKLGDIYYFQLYEKVNSYKTFKNLLDRFPGSEHEPEVLYKMYLLSKDLNNNQQDYYAGLLKSNYPNSTFTKIIINPDYLRESSIIAEQQKNIYRDAYEFFKMEEYGLALIKLDDALAMAETDFSPQLELLRVLITGKTESIFQYQLELDNYMKKYPDAATKGYADQLLTASREVQKKLETIRGINYLTYFDEPHYFVITHKSADKIGSIILGVIDQFDQDHYKQRGLTTSTLIFNDDYNMTLVTELKDRNDALKYFREAGQVLRQNKNLENFKFNSFVISKDNFDILYRTKGLNEYIKFFDKNYINGL